VGGSPLCTAEGTTGVSKGSVNRTSRPDTFVLTQRAEIDPLESGASEKSAVLFRTKQEALEADAQVLRPTPRREPGGRVDELGGGAPERLSGYVVSGVTAPPEDRD